LTLKKIPCIIINLIRIGGPARKRTDKAMTGNYTKIIEDNLARLRPRSLQDLASALPAERKKDALVFKAFGERCRLFQGAIELGGRSETGVLGVLISLYALHAGPQALVVEPLRAFKDLPDSMPYTSAFNTHTENPLIPRVAKIETARPDILKALDGSKAAFVNSGDFALLVRPLPKIALCYIFYHADDEFPASAKCLFSGNAAEFMPTDALADVGEYTSKKIIELVT
jgi:hypothetical protein